jgi:protein-tyrosine-phosphatase
MAKALFRTRLQGRGCDAEVASAGFLAAGIEPPAEVVEVMAGYGIDISGHRSRTLSPELVAQADLVATMTRQQLIEIVTEAGSAWTRCFTLTDLVRRAETVGPPGPEGPGGPVAPWVRRLHGGRSRASLLSLDLSDDINDPMNGRRSAFSRVAEEIDDLVGRLAKVVCPAGADISAW